MSTVQQIKQKNEKIKRRYLEFKAEADGFSSKSILALEKALWKFDDCTLSQDYAKFNKQTALNFKKYLTNHKNEKSKKILSLRSQYHHLRFIKDFFTWLSGEPGYKSRINHSDIMYLQLSKKDRQQATSPGLPKMPTLEQVKSLCSFPVNNEIDRRDRAMIAFLALSGVRDQAFVTLNIGSFDLNNNEVNQLPKFGVQTKYNKDIYTTVMKIDNELYEYFIDWYQHLTKERKFGLQDPLFPATLIDHIGPNNHTYEAKGVSKKFWSDASSVRKIIKERAKQTNTDYFYPHAFRHFYTHEIETHSTTVEQLKALSQSLGHEHISTTFSAYGNMSPRKVNDVMRSIDLSKSISQSPEVTPELIAQIIQTIKNQKT